MYGLTICLSTSACTYMHCYVDEMQHKNDVKRDSEGNRAFVLVRMELLAFLLAPHRHCL